MNPDQPDMFDGVFDNRATGHREVWVDGRPGRHAAKNCISEDHPWRELRKPWGTYPNPPMGERA